MARPKKNIASGQVYKLGKLGLSLGEMADFFGCDPTTLSKRFSAELDKSRAEMKMRLRRLQWRAAESGNTAMLIWLGKNYLGQSDEPRKIEGENVEVILNIGPRVFAEAKTPNETPRAAQALLPPST